MGDVIEAFVLRHLKAAAIGLRGVINTSKPLHWVEHFTPKPKHAWRRVLAADLLSGVPGATLIFVLVDKNSFTIEPSRAAAGDEGDVVHLLKQRALIARDPTGDVLGTGVDVLGEPGLLTTKSGGPCSEDVENPVEGLRGPRLLVQGSGHPVPACPDNPSTRFSRLSVRCRPAENQAS